MALKVQPPEIDGYEYSRHLGSGGYSEVFVYEHLQLGREVAVKVLTQGASDDEARVMAQLATHTHIVDVYSTGETSSGLAYLVMQLYSGPTFADRLKVGPLRVAEVLQLGVQLCGALSWAHRLGVLHRDVKPANILTSETGRPGLADFGIAASSDGDEEQAGVSLPWIAPEVLQGASPDETADVYALAATLFTLLEGHAPFVLTHGDNSDHALVGRTISSPPPALTRSDAPASLTALLRAAMAKTPSARLSSAEAFGRGLQSVEAEMRLAQTPLESGSTVTAPIDRSEGDATRVRGVTVIESQPIDDRTRARTAGITNLADTGTRLRPSSSVPMIGSPGMQAPAHGLLRTVDAPDVPGEYQPVSAPEIAETSRSRRNLMFAGVAAALVVGAIVVVALLGGRGEERDSEDSASEPFAAEENLTSFVPAVTDLRVERVNSSEVRAAWTAPAGVSEFVWRRCDDGADPSTTVTTDNSVTISPVLDGETVCVAVMAQLDGSGSEEHQVVGPVATGGAG